MAANYDLEVLIIQNSLAVYKLRLCMFHRMLLESLRKSNLVKFKT